MNVDSPSETVTKNSRPTKRARTDEHDYSSYTRDGDYFCHDGTVVLAAEGVLFKVHQSVLSRHSAVFHDMFSLPRPVDGGEQDCVEGVPVLDFDDASVDLKVMLRLTYDPPPVHITFDMIESALRMASKYDVSQLVAWGLHCLKSYPKANDSVFDVYKHSRWTTTYKDPLFCVRLICLTELLDTRALDGVAALAYYALSVVDWTKYDQMKAFSGLSPTSLERLTRGQRTLFSSHAASISQLLDHHCAPGHVHFPGHGGCAAAKIATTKTLIASLNGDFIGSLVTLSLDSSGVVYCRNLNLQLICQTQFRGISKAFGFESGTTQA